jgi:hypothetical protein
MALFNFPTHSRLWRMALFRVLAPVQEAVFESIPRWRCRSRAA